MARLTKPQARAHAEAEELLSKDVLTLDEKLFVIEHWQESGQHINTAAGAFFTPYDLASDFAIDVGHVSSVIDLCAGIGTLGLAVLRHHLWDTPPRIVCIELNPAYVAVGRKILPEAEWITRSVFDLPDDLGEFEVAISNPPFGRIDRGGHASTSYTGGEFEFHVVDVASRLAQYGAFILPQQSAPFRYSGEPCYRREESTKYARFTKQTGIHMEPGCGIDTSVYEQGWHLVKPKVEVVLCDFEDVPAAEPPAPIAPPVADDGALFDLTEVAS